VDLSVAVEILEALENFLEDGGYRGLVKDAVLAVAGLHLVLDDVEERAALEQPQHQPQLLAHHETRVVGHHVFVVA